MTEDEAFLAEFESHHIPLAKWTHHGHVRVAWMYCQRYTLAEAIDRMRTGLQALIQAHNIPSKLDQGYHETMTVAFMRLVYAAWLRHESKSCESWHTFCEQHPALLDKHALRRYYSPERILTQQAKTEFVSPDKCPLPTVFDDGFTMAAAAAEDLDVIRMLLKEFAKSLDFDLCFQGFDDELRNLPGAYALPEGRLLLARMGSRPAGCIALRPLGDGVCEMKRMWLRPEYRGAGRGRDLAKAILHEARQIGYHTMKLDTVTQLVAAISLYRSLGFEETTAYIHNPLEDVLFFELKL